MVHELNYCKFNILNYIFQSKYNTSMLTFISTNCSLLEIYLTLLFRTPHFLQGSNRTSLEPNIDPRIVSLNGIDLCINSTQNSVDNALNLCKLAPCVET